MLRALSKNKLIPTLIVISLSSCANGAPKLDWHGTIWAGSSAAVAVIAKKDGNTIVRYCQDPDFDGYVCMTNDDFADLQKAENERLLKCEKWK